MKKEKIKYLLLDVKQSQINVLIPLDFGNKKKNICKTHTLPK
jgi:hypothetical protein